VQQRLTQLAQEKGERERQQQIGALETQNRQDLRGENFLAARQKMEQIQRLQGNPGAINNEIDRGEQQKLNELEGKFNRARQQGNRAALEQLLGEFRNLAEAGGPVAARARSYANNQIPQALNDLEAAARRPETAARPAEAAARPSEVPPIPSLRRISCAVVPVAGSRYNRPVSAGSSMGQEFIDGGIVLNSSSNCGLPSDLIRGAREKSEVTVMVQIDEKGRVTGGRHLTGDAGVGQSVLQAAQQNWRFNPPRVNGIPVKTSAAVAVKF
jgi:TonB family protein